MKQPPTRHEHSKTGQPEGQGQGAERWRTPPLRSSSAAPGNRQQVSGGAPKPPCLPPSAGQAAASKSDDEAGADAQEWEQRVRRPFQPNQPAFIEPIVAPPAANTTAPSRADRRLHRQTASMGPLLPGPTRPRCGGRRLPGVGWWRVLPGAGGVRPKPRNWTAPTSTPTPTSRPTRGRRNPGALGINVANR
jgi:hypothetical protein